MLLMGADWVRKFWAIAFMVAIVEKIDYIYTPGN
jgi:hypothetical protein